jgi:hypothetical protein
MGCVDGKNDEKDQDGKNSAGKIFHGIQVSPDSAD